MTRYLVALILAVSLAGCGLFSRSKSRFYSLDRIPPTTPVVSVTGPPFGIDSLELPPGFDRRDIVVRKENHELDVRGTEQWSASLEPMTLHTLAADLAARLPDGMVVLPGQAKPLTMRNIDVAIEEFSAGPGNVVTLDARWTLRETGAAHHERITIDTPSLDSAEIAAGFSRALADLADRMAAGVR